MNKLQILNSARELISDPKRWTRGAAAKDIDGHEVNVCSINAACFCTIGALRKVVNDDYDYEVDAAMDELRMNIGENQQYKSVAMFNDKNDHSTVLDWFDRTIASMEK